MSSFQFKQFIINQEGAPFKVGTDSLILGSWIEPKGNEKVLDIGTGTGVLALMVAQKLSTGSVLAVEPERDAFLLAERNVQESKFNDRVIVVNEPLQLITPNAPFDLIITNPPYFSDSTKNALASSTKARHTDSLNFLEITEFSAKWLTEKGKLAVVLPLNESETFQAAMELLGFYLQKELCISSFKDKPVKRRCLLFGKKTLPIETRALAIRDKETQKYSSEYIELTKEYHSKL